MSSTYMGSAKTFIDKKASPVLHQFLDLSVNSDEEPDFQYFDVFEEPKVAKIVFYFIRHSKPPQQVYTDPYDEVEVDEIIKAWTAHSQCNSSDRLHIDSILDEQRAIGSIVLSSKQTDKLKAYITCYTKTSFVDGAFTFNNEYSSNDNCNLNTVVSFLNKHRDYEEKLISVIQYDDEDQPNVSLHVDNKEIELFTPSRNQQTIMFDWEGFYCGENKDRLVDNSWNYNRHHLPPVALPYRINWLNEAQVRLVKVYADFYEKLPNPIEIREYESKKVKLANLLAIEQEDEARKKNVETEKQRLKNLSDDQLLAEHNNTFITRGLSSKSVLLYNEINERGLTVTVIDPKADGYTFKQLNDAISKH